MGFRSTDFSNVFVPHIGNPWFGNLSQRIGNGLLFDAAAMEAGCQRAYPRPHARTRVSLRADRRGRLVHSNSHLAMALSLPLRRNLLLGLRTLFRKQGPLPGHTGTFFRLAGETVSGFFAHSDGGGLNLNGARRIYLSTQPHTCHNPMQINSHLR